MSSTMSIILSAMAGALVLITLVLVILAVTCLGKFPPV